MIGTHRKSMRLLALGLCLSAGLASAHQGASGIVKERMDAMKAMGAAMKAMAPMAQGNAPVQPRAVAELAALLRENGGAALVAQFPEGSIDHPSEARETIWDDPERFAALADSLTVLADELDRLAGLSDIPVTRTMATLPAPAELANSRGQMANASLGDLFVQIGRSCIACHEDFRIKK
ncbi:cytochrome c [Oceanomicrobium pacificus]|uniref:Cytochrome c n=1 Tax=Oceanomicrobium pacificus TaxID=2692916 RepID=A0A6B0TJE8_9RHOB|nr:cytochrome c [Oceanomicrobium pacificus]MXU64527.1 cytochrome c [Oceanomicrobium pacificus]